MIWFQLYLVAAFVTIPYAMRRSIDLGEFGLLRCALVIAVQFFATQMWFVVNAPLPWAGQPWAFYLTANALSTFFILRWPAGRGNAVMGGVTLAGMVMSAIYGFRTLIYGASVEADWSYWYSIFLTGWAALAVLLGWSHVDSFGRWADRAYSLFDALVRPANRRGVAR